MSSVRRDSAMADLPWPKSTAQSSTSATAFPTQNSAQQQGAIISDPADSEMHQDDIGDATFPAAPAPMGPPSYVSVDAAPTYAAQIGDYFSVPFAPIQERRAYTSHPLELTHSPSGQERTVHTIYFKMWNPDSPHRALFIQEINQRVATSSSLSRNSSL